MYDIIYMLLNNKFTCPRVRAAKQDKVIQLIRNHRIEIEQKMYDIRKKESVMLKQLLDIIFEDDHEKVEARADLNHG